MITPSGSDGDSWRRAVNFAASAHDGMKSAKLEAPYIAHPVRVALTIAMEFGCDEPNILCAALLHDVLEKTDVTLDEVTEKFGTLVSHWVFLLSKAPGEPRDSYWIALKRAPWQVRLIKIADVLDHLDCKVDRLPQRAGSVARAADLVMGDEPFLVRAQGRLMEAVDKAGSQFREPLA